MNAAEGNLLSSLLENEHFLAKVLSHLIDFGLHECRRVCRKWNDVCRSLPVKLKNVPIEKMVEVPRAFPNVVQLSTLEGHVPQEEMDVLHSFSRLSNLKQLEINLSALSFTIDEHFPTWFSALGQLEAFRVYSLLNAAPYFFEALKDLRRLTKLEFARDQGDSFQIDAIVPLVGLRELSIYMSQITTAQGETLFLSLWHLTKLEVTQDILNMTTPPLVALAPHMHQLKSLSLNGLYDVTAPTNWLSLCSKIRLEELRIRYVVRGLQPSTRRPCKATSPAVSSCVFPDILAIKSMIQLTSLDLWVEYVLKKDVWEALSVLMNLKSLKIAACHWMEDSNGDLPCPIPNLTKLTSLSLIGHGLGQDARRLTNLVELEFEQDQDSESLMQHSLPQLPRLEKLVIREVEEELDPAAISAFSLLKSLKSLSLESSTCIDVGLFRALALLPELTEFRYKGYLGHVVPIPPTFIHELTLLKQLHRLSFYGDGEAIPLLDLFKKGSHSHIMYLHSNLIELESDNIHQLFETFPCLRSFNIHIF